MLPRCFPDASLFPPYLRCVQGAPAENPVWKKPLALFQAQKMPCKIVANNCQNQCLFDHGFHRKSCACGVLVRMSFFVNLLTVSGSLDPRSARAGAVETLFLNLRIIVKKMKFLYFFCIFCDIWTSFPSLGTRVKTRATKNKKYHLIWVPKQVPKKLFFSVFSVSGFGGAPRWFQMVFLVPLGGPKGESQCSQGH